VDGDGLVELARPLGNLISRLAAAQTNLISAVLGARIAEGRTAEDPQLPSQLAALGDGHDPRIVADAGAGHGLCVASASGR
jgi:hypothetical protein